MNSEDIQKRLSELNAFILDSTRTVQNGEMVDLGDLDGEVASICDSIVTLPPEEALQIQPLMAEMIGHLEKLGEALHTYENERHSED
ncbi:MAG: hypothetical protein H6853_05340 [Rhodospirillales bacterium]|nr:hypothetical protein [Alphaproteobacteria bacterium]USO02973.1 MAG: hypothetical protein H6853_05340 [Rhodospirillales bacterium]